MRLLARLVAVAGLVVAGGLTLPGGAAQAAACSGSSGVTVVIDYGSSSSTLCAPDASTAGAVLDSVTDVTWVTMYGEGNVVCKINGVPSSQTCQRMPPASAYWAFFHASRGGSWTYSSSGVGSYNPAPGTVIGFAFGSGGAPSSPPPAATPTAPKPSPKPSPSSSSSRPPAPKPAGTTPAAPGHSSTSGSTPAAGSKASTGTTPGSPSATPGAKGSTTATSGTTTSTTSAGTTSSGSTGSGESDSAAAATPDSGSPLTLLAGLGLVGLVGAGAAYLAVRRRAGT